MLCIVPITIPSTAAGTSDDFDVAVPGPGTWEIISAYFTADTTTALDGTDYAILTLETFASGGTPAAAAAALTSETVAFTQGIPREFSVSSDPQRFVQEGYVIRAAKTEAACGAALHGTLSVTLRKVPEQS
jgi:hypothetical protein